MGLASWLVICSVLRRAEIILILSLHIPKTAGVSIRNVLKEHFGPGFVLSYWQITDAWGRVCPEVPAGATCVHGHYQASQLATRFPEARLMTWVRDPVERVVSSYHHRLRDPDWQHPVCHQLHRDKLSLLAYAAIPEMRNEMCHFFGKSRPADFSFIGVVEEFDHSFAQMREFLCMGEVPARHDNANPNKKIARYELEPAVRQQLSELNADDVALYKECRHYADLPVSSPQRQWHVA